MSSDASKEYVDAYREWVKNPHDDAALARLHASEAALNKLREEQDAALGRHLRTHQGLTAMTRAAVTVFIETDHEGDVVDAAALFRHALTQALNGRTAQVQLRDWPKPINIEVVDVMEAGMALGNRYLYATVTNKSWQERGR